MHFLLSDKGKHICITTAYLLLVPLYMLLFTHLINIYQATSLNALKSTLPIIYKTIWIPALLSVYGDIFIRKIKTSMEQKTYKWRSNPFIYIFIYSLYFFILHYFILTSNYLAVSLSGFLLVLFSFLIKPVLKELEYLPLREKFHFYMIIFLFPILTLIATDILAYTEGVFTFSFLLFPISYIPGLSLLYLYSFICKCVIPKKKRKPILIEQAASIALIGTLFASLYLVRYIGNRLLAVCFLMTIMMLFTEQIFLYTRQKMYQKQNKINK